MTAIRVGSVAAARRGDRPGGDVERRLHGHGGDVGQRLLDLLDGRDAEQVGGRDPEQLATAYRAGDADGGRRVVVPADGGRDLGGELGPGARHQLGVVGEQPDRLGRAAEQVDGVPAAGEQQRQPLRDGALVAQQPQVPVAWCRARR